MAAQGTWASDQQQWASWIVSVERENNRSVKPSADLLRLERRRAPQRRSRIYRTRHCPHPYHSNGQERSTGLVCRLVCPAYHFTGQPNEWSRASWGQSRELDWVSRKWPQNTPSCFYGKRYRSENRRRLRYVHLYGARSTWVPFR